MTPLNGLITLAKQNISPSKEFPVLYHSLRLLSNLSSDATWRDKILLKEKDNFFEDLFSVLLTFRSSSENENCLAQTVVIQIISNLSLHPSVQKSLLNKNSGSFNTLIGLTKDNSTLVGVIPFLFSVFINLLSSGG